MKTLRHSLTIFALFIFFINNSFAAPNLAAVGIDGIVHSVDLKTGALTQKGGEQTQSFNLGGIARNKSTLYYIAAPSGTSENSIYTVNLTNGTTTHADLDKSAGDDDVRVMFLKGKNLFAIFYNGNAGTAGLYKINPVNGVTTLISNYSELNVEIIGGAFAKAGLFYYTIVKPETDSTKRQLMKFRLNAKAPTLVEIKDTNDAPVLCERLKFNLNTLNFVCLAAPNSNQVDVCKLSSKGVASCTNTLPNIQRVAGGHTMMSPDGLNYYAFVYETGDSNSQRLVKFTSKGKLKSKLTIDSIIVGARFDVENEPD